MSVKRHGIVVLKLVRVIGSSDGFGSHFTASDSVNDLELFVRKLDVPLIELISDSPPPVLVFWLLDKLFDLVTCLFLHDFFEFIIIPEVLELIIPSIRNFTNLYLNLLVLFIIGFVFTDLDVILLVLIGSGSFQRLTLLMFGIGLGSGALLVCVNHRSMIGWLLDWCFQLQIRGSFWERKYKCIC